MKANQSWRLAPVLTALPAAAIIFLALYPQLHLWLGQGSGWHGSYAASNYDEPAYSAYVESLIEGKPRKHDPFISTDRQFESLYSIQVVPAYAIALSAKFLGISASTAFILLAIFAAAAASLSLFFFLRYLTNDPAFAAAAVPFVLCLGCLAAFQGELRQIAEGRLLVDFFPFLRRYQPALAFPLFFVFCGFVVAAFTNERRTARVFAVASGVVFVILVFSYFYVWTAAAAMLGCLAIAFLVFRQRDRRNVIECCIAVGVLGGIALLGYFSLLANRDTTIDSIQLLTLTHAPQLFSPVLVEGVFIAAAIVVLSLLGRLELRSSAVLVALAFALTPVVLLNQQIVTGRSLQPVHYEIFIANYLVLAAAALLAHQMMRKMAETTARKVLVYVAIAAFGWGLAEAAFATERAAVPATIRDESMPAIRFIQQQNSGREVVLATNFVTADLIPTVATVRTLWNPHIASAGGIDTSENRRLFYLYLYFSGFSEKDLADALRANSFEVTAAIFGSERALPSLAEGSKRITAQEISAEVAKYADFAAKVDRVAATNPSLTAIIVPAKDEPNLEAIDRWYARDAGTTFGWFKVYRLTPQP